VAIVSRDARVCFLAHLDDDDQRRGLARGFSWAAGQDAETPEDVVLRVRGELRGQYELAGRADAFLRGLLDTLDRHRADALVFAGFCLEQHDRPDWRPA
jgi:hypothetical protein